MGILSTLFVGDPKSIFLDDSPTRAQLKRTGNSSTSIITIDSTQKESFTGECEPTTSPIEKGTPSTDHIIMRPSVFTLEGIISETPLTLSSSIQGIVTSVAAQVSQVVAEASGLGSFSTTVAGIGGALAGKSLSGVINTTDPTTKQATSGKKRLSSSVDELRAAMQTGLPIDVVTGLYVYQSYILKKFTVSRDKSSAHSIFVSCEFQEVVIKSTLTRKLQPGEFKGTGNVDKGPQKPTDAKPNEAADNKTFLLKGVLKGKDLLGGILGGI